MGKPSKKYDEEKVGEVLQANYEFLEKLFGTDHKTLRDELFAFEDEEELRARLADEGIPTEKGVRIMLVDIEFARCKVCGDPINKSQEDWYVLVLPPKPRRSTSAVHKEAMAWKSAWYHASNDGYGM
jgi:hypothetical protein